MQCMMMEIERTRQCGCCLTKTWWDCVRGGLPGKWLLNGVCVCVCVSVCLCVCVSNTSSIRNLLLKLSDADLSQSCCRSRCSLWHPLIWYSSASSLAPQVPIKQRIKFKLATLTHNTLSSPQTAHLRSLLSYRTPTRSLRSANTNLLSVPRVRTTFASRGFSVTDPTV